MDRLKIVRNWIWQVTRKIARPEADILLFQNPYLNLQFRKQLLEINLEMFDKELRKKFPGTGIKRTEDTLK